MISYGSRLMVKRLMAHGAWLKAHGSRLMVFGVLGLCFFVVSRDVFVVVVRAPDPSPARLS